MVVVVQLCCGSGDGGSYGVREGYHGGGGSRGGCSSGVGVTSI